MRLIYIPRKKPSIKYGLLYNWYAATDVRNICNTGWHIPENSEVVILYNQLGGYQYAGGHLKDFNILYWQSPNIGADNLSEFNGRGSGYRKYDLGTFTNIKKSLCLWTKTPNSGSYIEWDIQVNSAYGYYANRNPKFGASIRPMKDTTTLSDGQTGTYTGNDGKIYRTICIGTQEWLADNLAETKYRNGDTIPEVTDNSAWAALTTGALCAYNNDWSNV